MRWPRARSRAPSTSGPSSATSSPGCTRAAADPQALTAVPLAGHRRRGPRRRRARRRAGAGRRRRRRGRAVTLIPIEEIEAARERIAGAAVRTPLVRLPVEDAPAEIWCKLETLQPINSFKIRGAANAVRSADPALVAQGLVTASAGNMAQGVAWIAREIGVPRHDRRPRARAADQARRRSPGSAGRRSSCPSRTGGSASCTAASRASRASSCTRSPIPAVMAGNGTIGLEILEDLPDVDAVVVPCGGGGLVTGIGSALRARSPAHPDLHRRARDGCRDGRRPRAGEPVEVELQAVVRRWLGIAPRPSGHVAACR